MLPDSLKVEIKNQQPIELLDLTRSFQALAEEYKRFADTQDGAASSVRLYIQEIRTGSIVAEIAAYVPALAPLFPFLSETYSLLGYGQYLSKVVNFLLGKDKERPNISKQSYQAIAAIVDPVAKDTASQLNISAPNGNVYVSLDYTKANAVQNAVSRAMLAIKEPETGEHKQVLLYWYQARNVKGGSAGDKAIIESISTSAVKVAFVDESLKAKMVFAEANPFAEVYVVDVAVETIENRPALYRILALHDKFPRPDSGQQP